MIKILVSLVCIALFILLIILGLINYNSRYTDGGEKENFSFLNQFPYEMQDNLTMKYSLLFKLLASLFGACYALVGMVIFFFDNVYIISHPLQIVLGIIFILSGIIMFMTFLLDLKSYKLHLISTALLFTCTFINYSGFGLYIILENTSYHIAIGYILLVIASLLLASLIFTPLKRWMYLEKEEKDGTIRYYRKRLAILPFMEWIFIFINVLLILIVGIF